MATIVTDLVELHKVSAPIDDEDDLEKLEWKLRDMLMRSHNAVGLSAVQIGIHKRAFVMKPTPRSMPVFIGNPIITKEKGTQLGFEGCLSLPGQSCKVKRPQSITIKGINEYRQFVKYKLSNFEARIACHEYDHLDGILMTDREREGKP